MTRRGLAIRCAVALVLLASMPAARALEGVVTRVSDGDTFWMRPAGGTRYLKVRIEGIDAPEICQPWGLESKRALESLLLRKTVRIEGRLRDDHGRRLARPMLGDDDIGARMVRDGHAWSYRFRDDEGPYLIEELAARAAPPRAVCRPRCAAAAAVPAPARALRATAG